MRGMNLVKKINTDNFIKDFCLILCVLIASAYLVNRQIKINDMKKDLEEIEVMRQNLEGLNRDLKSNIEALQDILNKRESNE